MDYTLSLDTYISVNKSDTGLLSVMNAIMQCDESQSVSPGLEGTPPTIRNLNYACRCTQVYMHFYIKRTRCMTQLVECLTLDREIPGSTLSRGKSFFVTALSKL
jgi:hypothetical protein